MLACTATTHAHLHCNSDLWTPTVLLRHFFSLHHTVFYEILHLSISALIEVLSNTLRRRLTITARSQRCMAFLLLVFAAFNHLK